MHIPPLIAQAPRLPRRRLLAALGSTLLAPSALLAQSPPRRPLVIGHLVDRGGPQADLARDYLAGAKVMFDAANAGAREPRVMHVVREVDTDPRAATAQALALVAGERAELLFGPSDALLPVLAASPELARRGVQIVAPLSGLSLTADHVWYTRADYRAELDAAIRQLRSYGIKQMVLAVAPDFAAGSLAGGTPWRRQLEQEPGLQALTLDDGKGDGVGTGAVVQRIAAARPSAVIVAGDTLAYGSLGRALAARGWYGFLVGLSAVNSLAAREILGTGYNGGIVLTQIAPGPQDLTLRVVKEHVGRMKQFLDEPASSATLAGYVGAAWLVRSALSGPRPDTPADLRRALQARVDVGDFVLDFTRGTRGSQYVQLAAMGGGTAR